MIVAGHQPNYLPWLGFFYKLAHCDVFVIFDDVQFTSYNYQHRTGIKGPKGPVWLIQPVVHSARNLESTAAVKFDPRVDWRRKHLNSLAHYYAKSAAAKAVLGLCREWLGGNSPYLAEANTQIIIAVAQTLGLRAEIVRSSTLDVVGLAKGDRVAEVCRRLGADVYLSGQGARNYQHEAQFHERGIELVYSDFVPREYKQLWGEFCPGLSIADALFNLGPSVTAALLQNAATEP